MLPLDEQGLYTSIILLLFLSAHSLMDLIIILDASLPILFNKSEILFNENIIMDNNFFNIFVARYTSQRNKCYIKGAAYQLSHSQHWCFYNLGLGPAYGIHIVCSYQALYFHILLCML